MPCFDPRGQMEGLHEDLSTVQKELDLRTRDLCMVMKLMRENAKELYMKLPATLIGWHLAHQDYDQRRGR